MRLAWFGFVRYITLIFKFVFRSCREASKIIILVGHTCLWLVRVHAGACVWQCKWTPVYKLGVQYTLVVHMVYTLVHTPGSGVSANVSNVATFLWFVIDR